MKAKETMYENPKSIEEKELMYQLDSLSAQIKRIELNSIRIEQCVKRIDGSLLPESIFKTRPLFVEPTEENVMSLLKSYIRLSYEQSMKLDEIANALEKLV